MHLYSHGLLHGDMIRPSNNMRKSAPYSEITSTREYPWRDYARKVASFDRTICLADLGAAEPADPRLRSPPSRKDLAS